MHPESGRGFTLIELLVVIAIIAVLSVVVVLSLNPAELLRQSRDANRLSDMDTLNHALSVYSVDQSGMPSFFMGSSSVVYVSLPDSSSTCGNLNLPILPTGYTYNCVASTTLKNTNGTGWIPVPFANTSGGSPVGNLPIDPTNQSSSRLYYTYTTNGTQYELTTNLESQKYKLGGPSDQITGDGGTLATVYEKGSKLGLEPLDYGDSSLGGYWPINEGTGSTAIDRSGNGNNGSWHGTPTGNNATYYALGNNGQLAGQFDGATDYIDTTNAASLKPSQISILYWFDESSALTKGCMPVSRGNLNNGSGYFSEASGIWNTFEASYGGGGYQYDTLNPHGFVVNSWSYIANIASPNNVSTYVNGSFVASIARTNLLSYTSGDTDMMIGSALSYAPTLVNGSWQPCAGLMSNVRIYNRALSASEIAAMYSGGK